MVTKTKSLEGLESELRRLGEEYEKAGREYKSELEKAEGITGEIRSGIREIAPGTKEEGPSEEVAPPKKELSTPSESSEEAELEKGYQAGLKRIKEKGEKGFVLNIAKATTTPEHQNTIKIQFEKTKQAIKELTEDLYFYKEAPAELRNAIRTDIIGGLSKIRDKVYNKIAINIWGGLNEKEIQQSVELIYARNQLSRVKAGKGDPRLTEKQAQEILNEIEKNITNPEVIASANRWREIQQRYFNNLVKRGKLDPESKIEDYAPIYVTDYTPDWVFNKGIPTRLKRPFRGYTKKAVGTTKEYKKDTEALLGHLLQIEHDNMIEDFIIKQAEKYDITPKLTQEQKDEIFGEGKKQARTNKIYEIEGKKYRAYQPDAPFFRQLIPAEINFTEYIDRATYDQLLEIASNLGIKHERVLKVGRGAIGVSLQYAPHIATQIATETSVLAHEIGHQLDRMYNLWERIVTGATAVGARGEVTKTASAKKRGIIQKELRALADLYWEGQEVSEYYRARARRKEEKIAHMVSAYIHAPERFKEVAPTVYKDFDEFIKTTAEISSLANVKRGISLRKNIIQKRLGVMLGREKKTYLLPEEVYNTFIDFSERGGGSRIRLINNIMGQWKKWAILSHFPSFNINNMVGDTWMALIQSPEPMKLLREIDNAIAYLSKNPANYTEYQQGLHKFIIDNAILDSAFVSSELPPIQKATNPLQFLLRKAQTFSQYRESIMRVAQASYLYKKLQQGEEVANLIRKYFNWIDTEELPIDKALGKIARETLIDYNAVSKTYRRIIRGFAFPFGTWYFKASNLMWKFHARKPLKAVLTFLSLPVIATLWNIGDRKRRRLERQLPDYVRERVHFILNETPDGNIKVWSLQLPQDVLIGTKIYSIAMDQAARVMTGEITVREAVKETLKRWGIKEKRGALLLTNFLVRFTQGLINKKDPYDGSPIYPTDPYRMTAQSRHWHNILFLIKSFAPFMSSYIREYSTKKNVSESMKEVGKNVFGLPALGIRDYTPKAELIFPDGTKLDWDTYKKRVEKMQQESSILLSIEDDFIKGSLPPDKYFRSDTLRKHLIHLRQFYGNRWNEDIEVSLSRRIINRINDPQTIEMWARNNYDRAKTVQEKIYWNNIIKRMRKLKLLKKMRALPKSVR